MRRLEIPAHEPARLRIFSLDLPKEDIEARLHQERTSGHFLGLPDLNADFAEILCFDDVSAMGLTTYLTEGYGVPSEVLEPEQPFLDSLTGYGVIALSAAFGSQPVTLEMDDNVMLVAELQISDTGWTAPEPLSSQAATAYTGPAPAAKKTVSDAAMSGRIATLALLVIFALTAVVVWISG